MGFPTRIYLTGFMGSGKSTVGPILANVLGYAYVDLDDLIEAEAGTSIPQLFAEEGEAAFRRLETAALRRTAERDRIVVALGGGAVAREENLAFVLRHGTAVYLRVPAPQLVSRLMKSRTDRPLLKDERGRALSRARLTEKVESMLAAREPFYTRVPVVVDAGRRSIGRTVDAVVEALRRMPE